MIIWTIGLEGCGHHGLEAIFKEVIGRKHVEYYKLKRGLHEICNDFVDHGDPTMFDKALNSFFNVKNQQLIHYIDNSFPSGFKKRGLIDQWQISEVYKHLSRFMPVKLIHLKRNIFNTINSHPSWDGGILGHAKKLTEINNFLLNELSTLKAQGVQIIEINYEDIEQSSNVLSAIIEKDENIIRTSIDKCFKPSKKCYKTRLDDKTIENINKIIKND